MHLKAILGQKYPPPPSTIMQPFHESIAMLGMDIHRLHVLGLLLNSCSHFKIDLKIYLHFPYRKGVLKSGFELFKYNLTLSSRVPCHHFLRT